MVVRNVWLNNCDRLGLNQRLSIFGLWLKGAIAPASYNLKKLFNITNYKKSTMAQVLVEDLDPIILEKLEILAKQHGHSLQAEIKHILEMAVQSQATSSKPVNMAKAREAAFQMRLKLVGSIHTDSAELLRKEREK
jgi:plasmid stability protein